MGKNKMVNGMPNDMELQKLFRESLMKKYIKSGIIGSLITAISLSLSIYVGRKIFVYPLSIMYVKIIVIINLCVFIFLALTLNEEKTRVVSNVFIETITVVIAGSMMFNIIASISIPEYTARAVQATMAILIVYMFFAGAIRDRVEKIIYVNLAGFILIMIAVHGFSIVKFSDFFIVIVCVISSAVFNRVYTKSLFEEFLLKIELNERLEQLEHEIAEKEELQKKLVKIASFDPLTKTYNRRQGLKILESQFLQSKREKHQLSICYMDIDNLKAINDNYGHSVGDQYILDFIEAVGGSIRGTDFCVRLGGDEFLLVFPKAGIDVVESVWDRIVFNMIKIDEEKNHTYKMSASHGAISLVENKHETYHEMVDEADKRMYKEKLRKKTA